jgi:hypothetical protein
MPNFPSCKPFVPGPFLFVQGHWCHPVGPCACCKPFYYGIEGICEEFDWMMQITNQNHLQFTL